MRVAMCVISQEEDLQIGASMMGIVGTTRI